MTSLERSAPTLRDLMREAAGPVPVMLAVTILVQVLGSLLRRRRRGLELRDLSPEDVQLTGAPPCALLDDPSRDPRVRIAVTYPHPRAAISDIEGTSKPAELHGTGALFCELLTGAPRPPSGGMFPRVPAAADRLLRRLLEPRARKRPSLEQALVEGRELGLELLSAWDRRRGPGLAARSRRQYEEDDARRRLAAAVVAGRRREVELHGRELSRSLGARAGSDEDLAVARGWLREQADLRSQQREDARRVSLKLVVTGAPLILATFLTGLLGVVMLFSA